MKRIHLERVHLAGIGFARVWNIDKAFLLALPKVIITF